MRPTIRWSALVLSLTIFLTSCSDDATSPTTPDVVERPTTVATARATTAASVWATNDLAALAAHWADGDLRTTPARIEGASLDDGARFDDTTNRWTIPLASDFHVGAERYEVVGQAIVTFTADGTAVGDAAHATAMRAEITLDVLPRLQKGLERDLELTTTVTLTVDDLSVRPLALSGDGHTAGRYSLVGEDTDERSTVDLTWDFALATVYRDCCPSGVVGLALDAWRTQVTLDGSPTVATQMVVDREWVEDVDLELPCVLVQEARGTSMRSAGPLLTRASPGDRVSSLVSGEESFSAELGPRAAGTLSLHGFLGGEPLVPATVPISADTRLDEALLAIASQLEDHNRWTAGFAIDDAGRAVLDNSLQTATPASTTLLAVYGNLDSESEGRGSHLRQTGPLLTAATATDDLRFLRTGADGSRLELTDGDVISLDGSIGGVEIDASSFEIGLVGDGFDGTTVEELRDWFEFELRANGAPNATVISRPDGSLHVMNAPSDPMMEDIRLYSGGRVDFDQTMLFGDTIRSGSNQSSAASLLAPAEATDVISSLLNGEGRYLNFEFENGWNGEQVTSLFIGGTRGGSAVTPIVFLVEAEVTPLQVLLDRLAQAFRISDPDGVIIDHHGRIVVRGDVGWDNRIETISVTEEGNLFSNLPTTLDFTMIEAARDARTFAATAPVFDARGATHDITVSFTKRTGVNVWDWRASADGDGTIVAGNQGSVAFHGNGLLAGFDYGDGATALVFVPEDGTDGAVEPLTIELSMGIPGRPEDGLTQYAYVDLIETHVNGQPYVRGADATHVELRLAATDGLRSEEIVLARFEVVAGGGIATSATLARAADTQSRLADLLTPLAIPIFVGTTDTPRDVRVSLIADGRPHSVVRTITPDASTVADLRDAIVFALGTDTADVRVGPGGHVVIDAPLEAGVLTSLRVEETAAEDVLLGALLDFEVTAQAAAGCR